MPRVIVKPGVTHRIPSLEGGLGELAAAGSIIDVTDDELFAFPDKLELYTPEVQADGDESLADNEELIIEPIDATRAAWSLAAELDVDLEEVEGTGADGMILKGDVEGFVKET